MRERFPIKPAHSFIEALADGIIILQPKELAGRFVEIGDAALRIGDDDVFLDGVKNGFEKTFLLRQAQKIVLHVLRSDAPESLN